MVTPTLGGGADATVNENANSVPWWKTPGGGEMVCGCCMRITEISTSTLNTKAGTSVQGPWCSFQPFLPTPPQGRGNLYSALAVVDVQARPKAHSLGLGLEAFFPWVLPKFILNRLQPLTRVRKRI